LMPAASRLRNSATRPSKASLSGAGKTTMTARLHAERWSEGGRVPCRLHGQSQIASRPPRPRRRQQHDVVD
jgi:hypothetical protein